MNLEVFTLGVAVGEMLEASLVYLHLVVLVAQNKLFILDTRVGNK